MREGSVQTVLGPIDPGAMGVTDSHDHLFLSSPAIPGQVFEDLGGMTQEVTAARESGIETIVEMTPIGIGRRPDLLRALSSATGVHLVAATGYHHDAHYPAGHWVHDTPVEELARRMVRDLVDGMHPEDWRGSVPPDPARAGVVKIGASYHRVTRSEAPRFVAAAIAARASGAAILVHTDAGTAGHEIVDLLERHGVPSGRIILAHLDRNPDAELHVEIAARGVSLQYDSLGRIKYGPDSRLLDLIQDVVAAGHLDRLLLGMDLGRRDYFRVFDGGPGLCYLMDVFVPRLRRRLGAEAVDRMLRTNPAQAFVLGPVLEPFA